jgi:hypothetical protein
VGFPSRRFIEAVLQCFVTLPAVAGGLNSGGKISADTALTTFFWTVPQEPEIRTHLLETEFLYWPSLKSEPLLRFRRKRESRGIYDEFYYRESSIRSELRFRCNFACYGSTSWLRPRRHFGIGHQGSALSARISLGRRHGFVPSGRRME